jgi:endonuclease/exonuclease/phosphatase family metal-dependent hydrolase
MKILSLNAWHGECKDELRTFLLSQLTTTDIFCFQEADGDNMGDIIAELFDTAEFRVTMVRKSAESHNDHCLYTITKSPIKQLHHGPLFARDGDTIGEALAVEVEINGKHLAIVNVHGVPYPGDKLDNEWRLQQTERIISWLSDHNTPSVVCGDFNLLPETRSVQNFAAAGWRNLIADYAVSTTRNQLAWARYPDNKQLFADYTFVSPDLDVAGFHVPDIEVSDHLPMIIDIKV